MTITSAAPFTYDDLLAMPDDGKQYEIIDGELVLNASPVPRHQIIAFRIAYRLQRYLDDHPVGTILMAPMDVVFSQTNVLQPDILYISNERAAIMTNRNISGAPDLVVEVLSESTRKKDETRKLRLYQSFDVTEIWIVDPKVRGVRVYVNGEVHTYDTTVTSNLLPGFELRLAEIFAE